MHRCAHFIGQCGKFFPVRVKFCPCADAGGIRSHIKSGRQTKVLNCGQGFDALHAKDSTPRVKGLTVRVQITLASVKSSTEGAKYVIASVKTTFDRAKPAITRRSKGLREDSSTTTPVRARRFGAALCLLALLCPPHALAKRTQTRTLLGVALSREVSSWLNEIERKLGQDVYAESAELDPEDAGGDFTLGASYLTGKGVAVVRVDESIMAKGDGEVEAVIAHELLHLRLRVRGYPLFLFSPTVRTRKGLAVDVEQSNVNDLVSMIEHRIFSAEMRRTGFDGLIDLTNGLEAARRRKGVEDSQAELINYARASLEWNDPKLLDEFTKVYRANGWERSLDGGERLAAIIRDSNVRTPGDVAPVFLRCMSVLYRAEFRVEPDRRFALARIYPQMIIYAQRTQTRSR